MNRCIRICLTAIWGCVCIGCTATNTGSSLESKAARMSPKLLRSQVLHYKALVEKAQADEETTALSQIYKTLAPFDTPVTPATTAALQAALAEYREKHSTVDPYRDPYADNLYRYLFFYEKLKEKGGDMTGLELDIFEPAPDTEKFPSPPIKEPAAPLSESPIKEPV